MRGRLPGCSARAASRRAARSVSTPHPHGLADATRDPARLGWWWRRWPQANIGLLTGELADVLDVDGLAGRAALRRWATTHGLRLDGPLARTGSGWHYCEGEDACGCVLGLV
jgi:hypothetical protein